MATDKVDINVDDFLPAKNPVRLAKGKRRAVSESGDAMAVEEHNGIEGKPKNTRRKTKMARKGAAGDDEASKDMRKIAVPAHRLVVFKFDPTFVDYFCHFWGCSVVCVGSGSGSL